MSHGTLLFDLVCNHRVFFVPDSTYGRISKCENSAGSLGCCCVQQSSCWSTYFSIETVHCQFSNNGWFHFKVKGMLKFNCYMLIILDAHVFNLWQSEIQSDPHIWPSYSDTYRLNLTIVQLDATYSVYYITVGSSTCYGCWHPSSGARTTVNKASGID